LNHPLEHTSPTFLPHHQPYRIPCLLTLNLQQTLQQNFWIIACRIQGKYIYKNKSNTERDIGKSSYIGYLLDVCIIRFQFINCAQITTPQNRAIAITHSVTNLSRDPNRVITQPCTSPTKVKPQLGLVHHSIG